MLAVVLPGGATFDHVDTSFCGQRVATASGWFDCMDMKQFKQAIAQYYPTDFEQNGTLVLRFIVVSVYLWFRQIRKYSNVMGRNFSVKV